MTCGTSSESLQVCELFLSYDTFLFGVYMGGFNLGFMACSVVHSFTHSTNTYCVLPMCSVPFQLLRLEWVRQTIPNKKIISDSEKCYEENKTGGYERKRWSKITITYV